MRGRHCKHADDANQRWCEQTLKLTAFFDWTTSGFELLFPSFNSTVLSPYETLVYATVVTKAVSRNFFREGSKTCIL
jgi:hypothetical protein